MERTRPDKKEELTPRDAFVEIYNAWYTHAMSPRGPKDDLQRGDGLRSVGERLSSKARNYLNETVAYWDGDNRRMVTRDEQARLQALADAKEHLVQRQLEEVQRIRATLPKSKGEKLHRRRELAQKRRGTKTQDIH